MIAASAQLFVRPVFVAESNEGRQVDEDHGDTIRARVALLRPVAEGTERRDWEVFVGRRYADLRYGRFKTR